MKPEIEKILIECVDLLEQGWSVEQILARYENQPDEAIRPFLETAVRLSSLASQPTLMAKQRSRQALLSKTAELQRTPLARPPLWFYVRQWLAPLAFVSMLIFLFATILTTMSTAAVPGDALYTTKRYIEDWRLSRILNLDERLVMIDQLKQERLREVEALLRTNRTADVQFEGVVGEKRANYWLVSGIQVNIVDTTQFDPAEMGDVVQVNGRTANGTLIASRILLLTPASVPSTPTPSPTPEKTPEVIMTPSVTATPPSSVILPSGVTASPTTPLQPTATPEIIPTHTPTVVFIPPTITADTPGNDNGNENGEDEEPGENENGENENGGGENQNQNDDDNDNEPDEPVENDNNANDDDGNTNDDDNGNNANDDDTNANDDDNSNDDDVDNDNDDDNRNDDDDNRNDSDDDDKNDNEDDD